MPSKYIVREFVKDGKYHVFNRGVDKRILFLDDEDYNMFYYYLFIYVTPLEKVLRRYHNLPIRLFNKNMAKEIDLLAYCLMPNHFHLLVRQRSEKSLAQFMKQITNAYAQYFNTKYKRAGSLFEGRYKTVRVVKDEQLVHLSRYIHLNPVVAGLTQEPEYEWSSYGEYIDDPARKICHTKVVLDYFPSVYAYKKFVHDEKDYRKKLHEIRGLVIEEELGTRN